MLNFKIHDTVEIRNAIDNSIVPIRGILLSHSWGNLSAVSHIYNGVYVLKKHENDFKLFRMGHSCKILPCRIVLTEKVMIKKSTIEELKLLPTNRRALVIIKMLEIFINC